jgi:hypothetical protein
MANPELHHLTDSLKQLTTDLHESAVAYSTPNGEKRAQALLNYAKALERYIEYCESLRAATRIMLSKLGQRGGVPGLLAEQLALQNAYLGSRQVLGGGEPIPDDALFGTLIALGLETQESEWPRALIKVHLASLAKLKTNLTHHEVAVISLEQYLTLTAPAESESAS